MSQPYLVIMAGGSGTRFWPKSTSRRPKQLLSFEGEGKPSLLGRTLERFDGIVPAANRMIVTTEALSAAIDEECPGVQILSEPQGRNTAPCVYWAAREISQRDPKAIMMVMPADHHMGRPEDFRSTVKRAAQWAAQHDDLVTLGVKPDRPETGYGYLKLGAGIESGLSQVEAFVEKPNAQKAAEFLNSGRYLWNGGMFIWRAEVVLRAFDEFMPELKRAWDECQGQVSQAYPRMTATSIDYGIMEKARNVVTFTLDCAWDDLGSWTSLETLAHALGAAREGGVCTAGQMLSVESSGNVVDAPGKLVALLGVTDLIVAQNGEALLVARKDRAQDIRLVVEAVKKSRPELA